MAYLTESQLKSRATLQFSDSADKKLYKSAALAKITIFLSHSHKDSELAAGLKNYLAEIGLSLYIDWQDTDMPANTNFQTALKIKNKIKEMNYFLLLATNNSVKSRWVPWELGVADGYKSYNNILIVPVVDATGKFEGNEYLQVYKRIETTSLGKLAVFEPSITHTSILVESYLK